MSHKRTARTVTFSFRDTDQTNPIRTLNLGPCPFLLAWRLLFWMTSSVDSPIPARRSSAVIMPVYSQPSGESPPRGRYDSGASFPLRPLSTYSNDMTRNDSREPNPFPPRSAFSREGSVFSTAPSKTGGLHSRTHSVEFLVAHDRSSKAISQPPSTLQVQSES